MALQVMLTGSAELLVHCALLASMNRCFFQPYMSWAQAGKSRHFCQWHSRHQREVHLLDCVCTQPEAGQEQHHPIHEVFQVGHDFQLTAEQVWTMVHPIILETRRYYTERMSFMANMPYSFAQLDDTDVLARRHAAKLVFDQLPQDAITSRLQLLVRATHTRTGIGQGSIEKRAAAELSI
ncbi:hypothetical protein V8C86DRAFT_2624290, partial [Haematococcus lacustris]